jgi:hypothetical protein
MLTSISLSGQWVGYFTYGPDYGNQIHGEKVRFRLFLKEIIDGQFEGKCVDMEGFGANMNTATIKGFLSDDLISFTKEYPGYLLIDETGETHEGISNPYPRLHYTGNYNSQRKSFDGEWEIWANERPAGDGTFVDILTGSWEMTKEEQ